MWNPWERGAPARILGLLGVAALWVAGCDAGPPTEAAPSIEAATPALPARHVSSAVCASCHAEAAAAWTGSHHDLAMQEATPDSVLGDFDDASFDPQGVAWRFFRRGDAYLVRTEGPDGAEDDFRVRYAFGVSPLQQYLVELPGGRLQALTAAWDTRPAAEGGQRWFSLHPDERVPAGDVIHWSGVGNGWNAHCGECHSTGFRKGYDAAADRYDTTWSEIDVACEACHGAGSRHVAWAEASARGEAPKSDDRGLVVDLRGDGATWTLDAKTGIARRSAPRATRADVGAEIDVCAPCHARRSTQREAPVGTRFLDSHVPSLLEEGLYFPGGQIEGEVYVYGSFLQSRMYAAGVTCSDCHDPHSLALRGDTKTVCARCHAPERFADESHHRHAEESAGAECVACHMPARTYMEIDPRRDHSFRVPRPDLSTSLGAPNSCNDCHRDRTPEWAAQQVVGWFGTSRLEAAHYGEAIAAGRRGATDAARALRSLAEAPGEPGIVRATALDLLARYPGPALGSLVARTSRDPDPLVRWAAVRASEVLPPGERASWVAPLLDDPRALVRREAGRVLAGAAPDALAAAQRRRLERAIDDYRAGQQYAADEPSAHVNLGLLSLAQGRPEQAEASYRKAIAVGDYFLPAYVNLADLFRATGRDAEGEALLRSALEVAPDNAEVHHALGLLLVRLGRRDEALDRLARAAELAPESARIAYVHGVALHSAGHTEPARAALRAAHERHPANRPILEALATFHRDLGDTATALGYVRKLEALAPGDPSVRALRSQLEVDRD